jgi:hypothetical protein
MYILLSLETPGGSCHACPVRIEPETTAEALFHQTVGGEPADYRILVNGNPMPWQHVLQDEDQVSFAALPKRETPA